MEIVMGVTWGMKQPRFAAERSQPVRGILFSLFALVAGAIVTLVHWTGVGGSISPPTPMLTQCLIASVVIAFWHGHYVGRLALYRADQESDRRRDWRCWWPATSSITSSSASSLTTTFMKGAPVYVAAQDPQGMFNGWSCRGVLCNGHSVMFLLLCFDLWPFTKSPSLMKQPVLGIVWTIVALVIGWRRDVHRRECDEDGRGGVHGHRSNSVYLRDHLRAEHAARFAVREIHAASERRVEHRGGSGFGQSVRAPVSGSSHAWSPGKLDPGPPAYQSEIWLASALLAVTFPFLVAYADFFTMWPLQRAKAEQVMETAGGR